MAILARPKQFWYSTKGGLRDVLYTLLVMMNASDYENLLVTFAMTESRVSFFRLRIVRDSTRLTM